MYLSDEKYEKALDMRVQARLATDAAYRNAEDADQQAERERQIEAEEVRELDYSLGRYPKEA